MSYFKAKMHRIRFRLGLRPRPRWGAYSAQRSPDALAGHPVVHILAVIPATSCSAERSFSALRIENLPAKLTAACQ